MLATACFEGPLDEKGNRGSLGTEFFASGQRYVGQYLFENQHGRGVCLHPNGFRYLGYLYAGEAEFCGRIISPTGAEYQGMFSSGQPHGAGQVTYQDGTRDSGLWSRGRLVRLLRPFPGCVSFNRLLTGHYVGWYDRRVLHVQDPESPLQTVLREITGEKRAGEFSLDQLDRMTNLRLRNQRAAGFPTHRYKCGQRRLDPVKLLAWCDDDVLCDVQTHAYRTEKGGRVDAEVVSLSVEELLRPDRPAELPPGLLERASLLLLHACAVGRADVIRLLLRTVRISADVTDSTGCTGLISAAVRGHASAVNTLLDHGADVNHVTDEGVTALSVCLALLHPDYDNQYHLDQLQVFTYLEENQEMEGVLEWRGGAAVPLNRGVRPFPSRPIPAAQKAKQGKKAKARASSAEEEEKPDIRMALVPGPDFQVSADAGGSRDSGGKSSRRSGSSRSRSPAGSERSQGSDSAGETKREGSAMVESQRKRPSTIPEGSTPEVDDAPGDETEADEPPASEQDEEQKEGEDQPEEDPAPAEPECSDRTTPPPWPTLWPEEPAEPIVLPDTSRTDGDATWQPPRPGPLLGSLGQLAEPGAGWAGLASPRARASLDQLLTSAAAEEGKQRTAVRLIEAFCSGLTDWRDTEYTAPAPGSVPLLPMIRLLLRRGASPETSKVPFPAVHLALLADDKPLLVSLLTAGGDPNSRLSNQLGGLAPLHVSCSLPGDGSVRTTGLLLSRAADPNVNCDPAEALLDRSLLERRGLDAPGQLGARRPLHVVCERPGTSPAEKQVTRQLLDQLAGAGADLEAACNGQSPLTLALRAGDVALAVDVLTRWADPLSALGPPHYNALGFIVSPDTETIFELETRKQLVRTLVAFGSDLLKAYPLSEEGQTGNVLDFATWIGSTDDNVMTATGHQLKGPQKAQRKDREAFLAFLADLLDTKLRHQEMAPLTQKGLFVEVVESTDDITADKKPKKPKKKQMLLLPSECFCQLCDHVLGKCRKGCPNYGRPFPRPATLDLERSGDDSHLIELEGSEEDDAAGKRRDGRSGRRKRRAEADLAGEDVRVKIGGILGPDGQPLHCAATGCGKLIVRRQVPCSACKKTTYCSKECRDSDWTEDHNATCTGRSRASLGRGRDSSASSRPRSTSGGRARKPRHGRDSKASKKSKDGKGGKKKAEAGMAGDGQGTKKRGRSLGTSDERRRSPRRGAASVGAKQRQSGMTPMKVPPWLQGFLRQFEDIHVGACRHLIQGEWYEDDCRMRENYSFI